jgi:hypothetical protein
LAKIELALGINFELKQPITDSVRNENNIIPVTEKISISNEEFPVSNEEFPVSNEEFLIGSYALNPLVVWQ